MHTTRIAASGVVQSCAFTVTPMNLTEDILVFYLDTPVAPDEIRSYNIATTDRLLGEDGYLVAVKSRRCRSIVGGYDYRSTETPDNMNPIRGEVR